MNTENENYAINNGITKLNDVARSKLFLLTKELMEFQTQQNLNILNINHNNKNIFDNYPFTPLEQNDYHKIIPIYHNFDIFTEIKKLTSKTTMIKNVIPLFKNMIETADECNNLKKFFKMICLINLIKSALSNKSDHELLNYHLLDKIHSIHPNLLTILNLNQLQNLTTKEEMNEYLTSTYNYKNINIKNMYDFMDEEMMYPNVFKLFKLFK